MTRDSSPSRRPAGRGGLLNHLVALASALAIFVESRLALFATESKTAMVQILALGACLLAAAIFFAFGYVFLIVVVVVGLAQVAQVPWVWIALGGAVLHFLLALVCVLIARSRMTKNPFPATAAELKKDREWLRNLDGTT